MGIRKLIAALGLCVAASAASATVTYVFTADGVTDNTAQQGTATFEFSDDGSSLVLTLSDDVDPTAKIASLLDGFLFTLSQTPLTQTLVSVTPQSVINCSGVSVPTTSCPAGDGTDPYGYGSTLTGSSIELGAGFTGGGFSYKPYGIVNESYLAPGGNGGLSNDQHNPLLVGPVEFTFALTGLSFAPEITSVTFLFGTVPDSQGGTCTTNCPQPDVNVPEPQTLALLGLGLVSTAWVSRRRRRPV